MKLRKALKRLKKVETLLSGVIEKLPENSNGLGDLLTSARNTVLEAQKAAVTEHAAASKKPPARAHAPRRNRLSDEGRRRISLAAKKRWADAKRKGANAVTGRRLKKTA